MLGREISEVPIYCARLAVRGEKPSDDDRKLLVDYTSVSSWITEKRFGAGRFSRAPEAPGYLRTEVDGRWYFVPFGLVSVFPDDQQLRSVNQLVSIVRLSPSSAFCLSGSGTFIGQVTGISDIDFCEYFLEDVNEIKSLISLKKRLQPDSQLIRVKIADKVYIVPFASLCVLPPMSENEPGDMAQTVKLDFIAKTKLFGVVAITNLVLPVDTGFSESQNLKRSFQFQEAVVLEATISVPRRPLINPLEIGEYLNWLRQEALTYARKSREVARLEGTLPQHGNLAIKALKRALSWFLMVGLSDSIESIVAMLKKSEMVGVASAARIQEVTRLLASVESKEADIVRCRLGVETELVLEKRDQLNIFFDGALSLAEDLVDEINVLMGDVPRLEVAA